MKRAATVTSTVLARGINIKGALSPNLYTEGDWFS